MKRLRRGSAALPLLGGVVSIGLMLLAVFQFHDLGTLAIGMILGQGMVFWGLLRLARVWNAARSANHDVIQRLERISTTYEHLTETHVMLNQSHLAILRELQRLSPPQIAKESA